MIIVLDTNILISSLIKDSITRKIILQSGLNFVYPEISLNELMNHKSYIIKKSGSSEEQFDKLLSILLSYISLAPISTFKNKLDKAKEIMKDIDINDTVFIATALALDNSIIWTDDSDFDRQKIVKTIKTKNLIKMFNKS